ncbi:MAG: hypothetical protein FWF13_06935 [Acidobacteria bacterium]|nr:hypothetical protein [Acidobacteriota bacterium]
MKHIKFVIILTAFAGTVAFAGSVDFNGEWVVDGDAVGSGITAKIGNYETGDAPLAWEPATSSGWITNQSMRSTQPGTSYRLRNFTIIPPGTFFDFTVNGARLTGSIIRSEMEDPVFDGKVNGNKITFTVREIIKERTYSYFYSGEISDDGILFDVRPPRDGGAGFKFTAKRAPR